MAIISASFNCYLRNKFTLAKYSKWGNNTQWVMFHLHSLNFTIKISQLWRLVEIAFEIFFFWIIFSLEQFGSIRQQVPALYTWTWHNNSTFPATSVIFMDTCFSSTNTFRSYVTSSGDAYSLRYLPVKKRTTTAAI